MDFSERNHEDPDKLLARRSWGLISKRSSRFEDYVALCLMGLVFNLTAGDVNVNELLLNHGFNLVDKNKNKTPDLCFLYNDTLYVGDLAVSQSVNNVKRIKREKYESLRQEIMKANPKLRVEELTFVLDETMANLDDIHRKLETLCNTHLPNCYKDDLRSDLLEIQQERNRIARSIRDHNSFKLEWDRLSKTGEGYYETYGDGKPISKFVSSKTDKEIFDMIWEAAKGKQLTEETNRSVIGLKEEILVSISESHKNLEKRKIKSPIDILANLDNNESVGDLELVRDYINDLSKFDDDNPILGLFPSKNKIHKMISIKQDFDKAKEKVQKGTDINAIKKLYDDLRQSNSDTEVYYTGKKEMYTIAKGKTEEFRQEVFNQFNIRKDKKDNKIKTCKFDDIKIAMTNMKEINDYFGEKAAEPIRSTNEDFDLCNNDIKTKRSIREKTISSDVREEYSELNSNKGVNYLNILSQYSKDCVNFSRSLKEGIVYTVPRQRSGIVLTYTGNNVGSANPTLYRVSITRFSKDDIRGIKRAKQLFVGNILNTFEGEKYIYLISKKVATELQILDKISELDSKLRMMITVLKSGFDNDNKTLWRKYKKEVIGSIACMMCDVHQNPSNILDLIKYVSGMIFADRSNAKKLLKEKLCLIYKTSLDMYLTEKLVDYYINNVISMKDFKEKYERMADQDQIIKDDATKDVRLTSFFTQEVEFSSVLNFFQEAQMLFQTRPKKLYKSQFIDKSAASVGQFNLEKETEDNNIGINSIEDYFNRNFDFNTKHQIEGNAIVNAIKFYEPTLYDKQNKIKAKIFSDFEDLAVNNTSMRSACRRWQDITRSKKMKETDWDNLDPKFMQKGKDKMSWSETALLAHLETIDKKIEEGNTESCKVLNYVRENNNERMQYNMSEKEQRGGGRPIGSPDAYTKQALYVLDQPFGEIGQFQDNNLLARKVNRSAKISNFSEEISNYARQRGNKYKGYLTQDQTKFSESDVMEKFIILISNTEMVMEGVKELMIDQVYKMKNRIQHFPRIPKSMAEDSELSKYIEKSVYIRGETGWVQGMLNRMSTYMHIVAVEYLSEIFRRYYKDGLEADTMVSKNLVNSDDSAQFVTTREKETLEHFNNFMEYGKKMFALKLNNKKSYISYCLGEVIQKYEFNGGVLNIWGKEVMSSLELITGFDMSRDTLGAVGLLGTLKKNGVPEEVLVVVRKELKDKINRTYNRKTDSQKESRELIWSDMCCEMGGWPSNLTTFELANAGTFAQMSLIRENIIDQSKRDDIQLETQLTLSGIALSGLKDQLIDKMEKERKNIKDKTTNGERPEQIRAGYENKPVRKGYTGLLDLIAYLFLKIEMGWTETNDITDISRRRQREHDTKMNRKKRGQLNKSSRGNKNQDNNEKDESRKNNGSQENEDNEENETWYFDKLDKLNINDKYAINESSIVRSLICPWGVSIPRQKKMHATVDMLSKYNYESSGIGALFKVRDNIQTAIADKKETAQMESLMMTEENATRNVKIKNIINKSIKMGKRYRIPGLRTFLNVKEVQLIMLEIYDVIKQQMLLNDIIEKSKNILSDPTNRSEMTKKIIEEAKIVRRMPKGRQIVNKVPMLADDIITDNDLVSVLIEIVKPGFLKSQKYNFRSETSLKDDIALIKHLHSNWISSNDKISINNAMKIYYHYLKIRNQRYHISSYLNSNSMIKYLIDDYFKSAYNDVDLVGYVGNTISELSSKFNGIDRTNMESILGCYELIKFLIKYTKLSKEQICSNITIHIQTENHDNTKGNNAIVGTEMRVMEVIESDMFRYLFKIADNRVQKCMAILQNMLTGSKKLLESFKTIETTTRFWIREQKRAIDDYGKQYYKGDFKLQISKGKDVITVEGVEGDIQNVETNTLDVDAIVNLLVNMTANVSFKGYSRITDKRRLFQNGFFQTTNNTSKYYITMVDGEIVLNTNHNDQLLSKKREFNRIKQETHRLGISDIKYFKQIPVTLNHKLRPNAKQIEICDDVHIDFSNDTIVGTRKAFKKISKVVVPGMYPEDETKPIILFRMPYMHKESQTTLIKTGNLLFNDIKLQDLVDKDICLKICRGQMDQIEPSTLVEIYQNNFSQTKVMVQLLVHTLKQLASVEDRLLDNTQQIKTVYIDLDKELKGLSMVEILEQTMSEIKNQEIDIELDEEDEINEQQKFEYTKKVKADMKDIMQKYYIKYCNKMRETYKMRSFGKDLILYLMTTRSFMKVIALIRKAYREETSDADYRSFEQNMTFVITEVVRSMSDRNTNKHKRGEKREIFKEKLLKITPKLREEIGFDITMETLLQSILFSLNECVDGENYFWELCKVIKVNGMSKLLKEYDREKILLKSGVDEVSKEMLDFTEDLSKLLTKKDLESMIASCTALSNLSSVSSSDMETKENRELIWQDIEKVSLLGNTKKMNRKERRKLEKESKFVSDIEDLLTTDSDQGGKSNTRDISRGIKEKISKSVKKSYLINYREKTSSDENSSEITEDTESTSSSIETQIEIYDSDSTKKGQQKGKKRFTSMREIRKHRKMKDKSNLKASPIMEKLALENEEMKRQMEEMRKMMEKQQEILNIALGNVQGKNIVENLPKTKENKEDKGNIREGENEELKENNQDEINRSESSEEDIMEIIDMGDSDIDGFSD